MSRTSIIRMSFFCASLLAPMAALGQAKPSGTAPVPVSRFDIYGGYGAFLPISSSINNHQFDKIYNPNATLSLTDYFGYHFGLQVEGGYFSGNGHTPTSPTLSQTLYTAEAGPVFRYQMGRLVPFAHVLGGGARVRGPVDQQLKWGYGATGGVGVDYVLPLFHDLFAIRPIQADVQYEHVNHGETGSVALLNQYGVNDIVNVKLSAGLVARFGAVAPPPQLMEDCNAQPGTVYPGDPITVTPLVSNRNPKKKLLYTWQSTGGQLTPGMESASISTAGMAPGTYTVTGHVVEGGKAWQQASCSGNFIVKPFDPPTLSCSAQPTTVLSGTPANIASIGNSPQNRALTYSYTATAGQINGSGATVALATNGIPAGTVDVTCHVTDDLGQMATSNASIAITVPPPAPMPTQQNLCSVSFERDTKRPVRVDNEAKGCLDDIALTMNHDATSKLVIVGKQASAEKPQAAAQRAANVRLYLTQEKGIDPTRIELRTGAPSGRSVDDVLLPAGASFDDAGTVVIDPTTVHPKGQPYGRPGAVAPRSHKRKKS